MIDPTAGAHDAYADRDRYAEWDAAYVLGALSPNERLEFEAHLSGCARCASAVADLAGLPGLLSALDDDEALVMLDAGPRAHAVQGLDGRRADARSADVRWADARWAASESMPADILAGLTARVRLRRRLRSALVGVTGAVAAAVVAAAIIVPLAVGGGGGTGGGPGPSGLPTFAAPAHPTVSAALDAVVPSSITASVGLTSTSWGTSIALSCQYKDVSSAQTGTGYATPAQFALYVTARDGTTTEVSSWSAGPGDTVHASASIATPIADIAGVQLRSVSPNQTLLAHSFS
ncbi:anti-sigma factor family protein [Rathayibacter soli]|uniref:anti-sigma factor family protein n=1 Tax=Rathayibacter soli TaxID=3144168 RepID=UPI0027E5AE47|nr:zf-HC2 domain-containing protein [Glaciibacter superstes]